MALLNFPSNPQVGDTYTIGSRTWIWNGAGWQLQSGITSYDPFTANRIIVTTSTNSTSTNSGGLIVFGGAGFGLDVTVGGAVHIEGTATSYSTTSGSLIVAGGVGIGGDLYGYALYDQGSRVITQASLASQGVTAIYGGVDISVNTSTGVVTINNTSTLQTVTSRGNITDASITITNPFNALGTDTGALVLAQGGAVINKDIIVGGKATIYDNVLAGGLRHAFGSTGTVQVASNIPTFGIVGSTASTYQLMVTNPFVSDAFVVTVNGAGGTKIGSLGTGNGDLELFAASPLSPGLRIGGLTGKVSVLPTTSATSTSSGALTVGGGAGFGGSVYAGDTSYVLDAEILTTATISTWAVSSLTAGTDTVVSTSTGAVVIWNESTLDTVAWRNNLTTSSIKISNGISATDQFTGALTVLGGVGVGGSLYAGNIYANGSAVVTQATLGSQGVVSINAGTDTAISTSSGPVIIWSTATLESITRRGSETSQAIYITNDTSSTNWATGALKVFGGVGIQDNLNVKGTISATGGYLGLDPTTIFQNTSSVAVIDTGSIRQVVITVAENTTSVFLNTLTSFLTPVSVESSLTTTGGIFAASTSYVRNAEVLTTATIGSYVLTTVVAGTDTAATTVDRTIYIWNTSTLQSVTTRGSQTNQVIYFTNTSQASSTQSGAIQVTGGAGIGGNLWVGGNFLAYGDTTLVGNLTVLGTQTTIYSTATSIQDPVLNLGAPSDLGPLAADDSLDKGILIHYNTLTNASGDTHAFFGFRRADEKFVYYKRTEQQGRVGIDNPFFAASLGDAEFATLKLSGGTVSSNEGSGDLVVAGGVGIGGALNIAGVTKITNSTSATNTVSGALQVAGGVGIQGDLYVGGRGAFVNGFEVVTTATIGTGAVANIVAGTDTAVTTATGNVTIWNTSTLQSVTNRGATTTNIINFTNSTIASTTTNGAVVVTGGVGIGLTLHVGGDTRIWSTATTALSVSGGTTVGGSLDVTEYGAFGSRVTVGSTVQSTGTSSGALTVAGGVGLASNLNVGNSITAGGTLSVTSTATLGDNLLLGPGSVTRGVHGSQFISNGNFVTPGDAQAGIYMLRISSNKVELTGLTLDGISVSAVNQISLPNNSTYNFKIYVSARSTTSNDEAGWEFNGVISRYANPGSTAIKVVNKTKLWSSNSNWDCAVTADTVNGALVVSGAGDGTNTIRFVAKVETVEVTN